MKLHEALRRAVWQFGINILQDHRLMPVLADYRAFDDYPAMKQVMKAVSDAGHGKEFCRIALGESPSECLSYAGSMKEALIRNSHFTEEFAGYATDSLAFALGLRNSVHEPSDHGFDAVRRKNEPEHAAERGRSRQKTETKTQVSPERNEKTLGNLSGQATASADADNWFSVGEKYFYGLGLSKNYTEAARCYRKAAELGHPEAARQLGLMYREGLGVEQSLSMAEEWSRKGQVVPQQRNSSAASEDDSAESWFLVGEKFYYGLGLRKNYTEAVRCYRKAADLGHAKAAEQLRLMYRAGFGRN